MTGITYHPLYDPNHCVFRLLCLFRFSGDLVFEDDRLRIIDFYVLNPFLIKSIELTKELRGKLNQMGLDRISLPYQELPKPRALFNRLEPIQRISIRHLAGLGLISRQRLLEDYIQPTLAANLSADFAARIDGFVKQNQAVFSFLVHDLAEISLSGKDGLKRRTELMEHRYDAA